MTFCTRIFLAAGLACQARVGSAQVTVFEANNVFPEADAVAPWTRVRQGPDTQRWFDSGLFCQLISPGELDGYRRAIAEFTGSPSFFVTWREITDFPGPVGSGTPNGMSVASSGPVLFSFVVTSNQVSLVRDNPIGLVLLVDIQPGVLHTYYLALHGDLSYEWFIDGMVVNSGHYPSAFPDSSARILWWAQCFTNDPPQTAKWDFVRYGVIPIDHSGDYDRNSIVDQTDLYFFVDCLLAADYDAAGPGCRWADMNSDGRVDGADIQLFVNAMMGG